MMDAKGIKKYDNVHFNTNNYTLKYFIMMEMIVSMTSYHREDRES